MSNKVRSIDSGVYRNMVDGKYFFFNKYTGKFYKVKRRLTWRFWEKWFEITAVEAKFPEVDVMYRVKKV